MMRFHVRPLKLHFISIYGLLALSACSSKQALKERLSNQRHNPDIQVSTFSANPSFR